MSHAGHRTQPERVARRISRGFAVLLVLLAGEPRLAGAKKQKLPAALQAGLAVEEAYTDNVQEQLSGQRQSDFFTSMSGRLAGVNLAKAPFPTVVSLLAFGRIYDSLSDFNYWQIRPEALYDFGRTDLMLYYEFSPDRLLFAPDDGGAGANYTENAIGFGVRHQFGEEKRLRLGTRVEGMWQNFRVSFDTRDNFTATIVNEARYRIGPLVPRLAFEFANRQAKDPNYDRQKFDIGGGVDVQLPYGILFRAAYELSIRDYTVGSARDPVFGSNSNFGRDDDLHQVESWLLVPVPLVQNLFARPRFRFREGLSNRPDRNFTLHELGLELAYYFR